MCSGSTEMSRTPWTLAQQRPWRSLGNTNNSAFVFCFSPFPNALGSSSQSSLSFRAFSGSGDFNCRLSLRLRVTFRQEQTKPWGSCLEAARVLSGSRESEHRAVDSGNYSFLYFQGCLFSMLVASRSYLFCLGNCSRFCLLPQLSSSLIWILFCCLIRRATTEKEDFWLA